MLVQVFNSTVVSGPETLVIPSLSRLGRPLTVVFLCEYRKQAESRRPIEYAKSFGLDVREVWVRSRYDQEAIRELSALFESLDAKLVHSHDVKASAYTLAASRLSKSAGRKNWRLLSTHHGVRGRSGFKVKAYEWYYTHFLLPHFDRVLAVCTSDRKLLASRGLDPKRVLIHLNGVDRLAVGAESRSAESARIRRSWSLPERGIDPDTLLIGYVGRLSPEKRLNRILKICFHIKQKYPTLPPWKLVAFGTGGLERELKEMTHSLDLEDKIAWMGYRSGLGDELAGFDIVISMSDAEGLPINLIEAGFGGTPVFATRVDGNLDLMPTDDLGVLVDVSQGDESIADRLVQLMTNAPKREKMGIAFQKRVANGFSGQRWIDDLKKIYLDLQGE
jgi:glycosyltransferase involved in cell wall biosynthesis